MTVRMTWPEPRLNDGGDALRVAGGISRTSERGAQPTRHWLAARISRVKKRSKRRGCRAAWLRLPDSRPEFRACVAARARNRGGAGEKPEGPENLTKIPRFKFWWGLDVIPRCLGAARENRGRDGVPRVPASGARSGEATNPFASEPFSQGPRRMARAQATGAGSLSSHAATDRDQARCAPIPGRSRASG